MYFLRSFATFDKLGLIHGYLQDYISFYILDWRSFLAIPRSAGSVASNVGSACGSGGRSNSSVKIRSKYFRYIFVAAHRLLTLCLGRFCSTVVYCSSFLEADPAYWSVISCISFF